VTFILFYKANTAVQHVISETMFFLYIYNVFRNIEYWVWNFARKYKKKYWRCFL